MNLVWKIKPRKPNKYYNVENNNPISRDRIINDLVPKRFGKRGMIWTSILIIFCLAGAYAYYRQLTQGLVVTNMRDYVSWGIYISNFVFFVAISLVGSTVFFFGPEQDKIRKSNRKIGISLVLIVSSFYFFGVHHQKSSR